MHKKVFFHLILFCIVLATPFSKAANSQPRGPVAYLQESVYNFEPVVEGTTVTHEFVLQHRGQESLNILKIKSG